MCITQKKGDEINCKWRVNFNASFCLVTKDGLETLKSLLGTITSVEVSCSKFTVESKPLTPRLGALNWLVLETACWSIHFVHLYHVWISLHSLW